MVFVEARLFTRLLPSYLADEEYRLFQRSLVERPESGDLIKGTGGLRKVRWAGKGKGKSGGVRVIYYWARSKNQIYLLAIYGKGDKATLTAQDLKRLKVLVQDIDDG